MTSERVWLAGLRLLRDKPWIGLSAIALAEFGYLLSQHPELARVVVEAMTYTAIAVLCALTALAFAFAILFRRIDALELRAEEHERETHVCRREQSAMRTAFLEVAMLASHGDGQRVRAIVDRLDKAIEQAQESFQHPRGPEQHGGRRRDDP